MSQDKPFHKTASGKVFLTILGLIFLFLLGIGGKILYYSYQLKFGSEKEKKQLVQKFEGGFSTSQKVTQKASKKELKPNKVKKIIRDYNPRFGSGDEVTIIAFMDFGCPYCQKQYPILEEIMDKYKPAVQVVFKHFPLSSLHPNAKPAALASTCAQDQDRFWDYYDQLYQRKSLNKSSYITIAKDLNLNVETFKRCLNNQQNIKRVEKDLSDGISIGVRGTPTFIVENKKLQGVVSKKRWKELIFNKIKGEDG
ncbi:MAG: DsbA family protein [Candidatus Paceibacteria bacterium]